MSCDLCESFHIYIHHTLAQYKLITINLKGTQRHTTTSVVSGSSARDRQIVAFLCSVMHDGGASFRFTRVSQYASCVFYGFMLRFLPFRFGFLWAFACACVRAKIGFDGDTKLMQTLQFAVIKKSILKLKYFLGKRKNV